MRPRVGFDGSCAGCSTPASTPGSRYGNDLTALMWAAGHEDGVGPLPRSASSICCSRAAQRSTPPTIAAAPR